MLKKRIRPLLALALAVGIAGAAPADAGQFRPLGRTVVVHLQAGDNGSSCNFLAAVAANVQHVDGDVLQAPVISDRVEEEATGFLLDDWKGYLAADACNSTLVFVGAVSDELKGQLKDKLGVSKTIVISGAGPVEVAAQLAQSGFFQKKGEAVIVPLPATVGEADVYRAANGAALAAADAIPLLYMPEGGRSEAFEAALRDLGIVKATVVGGAGTAALEAQGVAVTALPTEKDVVGAIRAKAAGKSTVVFAENADKACAAAIAAARYQGFVASVPETLKGGAREAMAATPKFLTRSSRKLEKPVRLTRAQTARDAALADAFYAWLGTVGGEDETRLEVVITFADGTDYDGLSVVLERSLYGDPAAPTQRGASASRIQGSADLGIAVINRTTLYKALIFANPRPTRITMAMTAYEAEFPGSDTGPFTDNDDQSHWVNEFYGDAAKGDPGVWNTFKDAGFPVAFHDGMAPGDEGVKDPFNGEQAWGLNKDLADGTAFFYNSSHGSTDSFHPMEADTAIQADVAWGQPHWPTTYGRVNYYGGSVSTSEWLAGMGNHRSAVAAFNSCLVGGGGLNKAILSKGGAASISSYISVSFDGSGWYWCLMAQQMSKPGVTLGEAVAHSLARTSEIFPAKKDGKDSSLRYVLFGDANMEFVKPDWCRPNPVCN